MKLFHAAIFIWSYVILQSLFSHCDGLDCFSCVNVTSTDACHVSEQCLPRQFCYTKSHITTTGQELFTMGCRTHQAGCTCDSEWTEFCQGIGRPVGRDIAPTPSPSGCLQCCSLHGCNKYLCPIRLITRPTAVNGAWSDWGPWGACSHCEIGLQSRYRKCDKPAPSATGRDCIGDAKDVQLCREPCTAEPITFDIDPQTTPAGTSSTTTTTTTTAATTTETTTTAATTPTTTTTTATTATTTTSTNPTTTVTPTATKRQFVTVDLTQAPGDCRDLIDCSGYYPPEACHGIYEAWSRRYCPVHCGYCPAPSPLPCVDTIANCQEFQADMCDSQVYWQWRESHCRKFCKLC